MKKKKYNRPFVEVLMLETSGGMMFDLSKGEGNPGELHSMKRPGPSSSNWDDDVDEAVEDCDFGYCN